MRPPFVTVNRPERGGNHDLEALTLDVLDLCYKRDQLKFYRLCRAAERCGISLREYVARQVKDLLATVIKFQPPSAPGLPS
jgi:hypothetical protein